MKRGFTLLELLAALAITSVVITLLFNSLFQTTQIVDRSDNLININTRAILVQHQLEKDLMGTFLPVQSFKEKEEEKKPEKKESKKLTKVFYGINRGPILDILTFITNNPMSAYWGKQTGKAKPKIARIVYRLVKDKEIKESYTLLRQEDSNLEFNSYGLGIGPKEIRSYALADGIKELSVNYKVILEPEEKKEKQEDKKTTAAKAPTAKKEIKFKTLDQWNMEKEMPKDIKRRIPNVVDVKISFWDDKGQRDVPFEFSIHIIPETTEEPIKKSKDNKKDKNKKDHDKQQPAGQKAQQSGTQDVVQTRRPTQQPTQPQRLVSRIPTPGKSPLISMLQQKGRR